MSTQDELEAARKQMARADAKLVQLRHFHGSDDRYVHLTIPGQHIFGPGEVYIHMTTAEAVEMAELFFAKKKAEAEAKIVANKAPAA